MFTWSSGSLVLLAQGGKKARNCQLSELLAMRVDDISRLASRSVRERAAVDCFLVEALSSEQTQRPWHTVLGRAGRTCPDLDKGGSVALLFAVCKKRQATGYCSQVAAL